jgi:small-conductance mechanosensitive channel
MFNFLRMNTALFDKVVASVIIIAVALLLSAALGRLIDRLCDSKYLAPLMAGRLQRFRRLTIFSLTLLVVLEVLGVFGSAWAVISAGLAALAIGFIAAWSMLSNATAALLVLTFRPFRLGDKVELLELNGAGLGGQVVDINLMYTTLTVQQEESDQPPDHQFLQIPNSLFFQKVLRTRSPHAPGSKATFFS